MNLKLSLSIVAVIAMLGNPLLTKAQLFLPSKKKTAVVLKKHVQYLASDELEGRMSGSKGEALAAEYLIKAFKEMGLPGAFDGEYKQGFEVSYTPSANPKSFLTINGIQLEYETDFFALQYSAAGKVAGEINKLGQGISAPKLDHDDYQNVELRKGIVLVEMGSPDGTNPHGPFAEFANIRAKINAAEANNASAIIFIDPKGEEQPDVKFLRSIRAAKIPVLFLTAKGAKKANLQADFLIADMNILINRPTATANNVACFIDNQAEETVVIGAHYDHLGMGHEGGSREIERRAIHNGADDNASGTAALIELARYLKKGKYGNRNYIIVAFSGEELGLLGSSYMTRNLPLPKEKISYMLNMDMVGRLDEERSLGVNGVGSSPAWALSMSKAKNNFNIKTTESGIGNSDHTSFYLNDIPAIHFFTGAHDDYHKPEDDWEKLNYIGQAEIMRYMLRMIKALDKMEKVEFSKTKEEAKGSSPNFKVTLGIMPGYFYEGEGLKVDGVSKGKTAEKAGLLKGDVIVQMGEMKISDINSYMEALARYEHGDSTEVRILRGEESHIFKVIFD